MKVNGIKIYKDIKLISIDLSIFNNGNHININNKNIEVTILDVDYGDYIDIKYDVSREQLLKLRDALTFILDED